ncbi:MAG: outer membrane protein assembly factor BamE [Verrucomicrobia bacterium]|nr:outer membrane protein assembly factor BamE [Verrucomicrobiota bacterium]
MKNWIHKQQKNLRIWIAACSLAVVTMLAVGCVHAVGDKKITDANLIDQIKPGSSTKADVRRIMGAPLKTTFTDNNEEVWDYAYTRSQVRGTSFIPYVGLVAGGADSNTATLTVRFTTDGIVKNVGTGSMKGGGGGVQDLGR